VTTDSAIRPQTRGESRAARPVRVAVRASDSIVEAGAAAYLHTLPGIVPLPATAAHQADVVLVLGDLASEETLGWMQRVAGRTPGGESRFVLIGDEMRGPQLRRAARCGLVSVLPRQGCDYEHIVRAIVRLHQGRVELPGAEFRALMARTRTIETSLLAPAVTAEPPAALDRGPTAQLEDRERDVLRLLADGLATTEIAATLSYSERTVKNIIHQLLARMNLRNRPHAVAYALRNGLL
jgi:DNA-binding NarL/FixJ family response regulator